MAGHILAWVYSAGFPVSVRTPAPVSIHGLTFARNRAPDPAEVRRATRVSPLFAGPRGPGDGAHVPQTFDAAAEWLGDDMPLPSMSLGYTGERGNSREEVIACLVRGARSDGTAPAGTVYFVRGDDVRSTCRHWQFAGARRELLAAGVDAVITNAMPRGGAEAIGLMMGAAWADPAGIAFRPGAMAEHLTSSAAVFHSADQTKLSAWIAAGATASAGAVAEPFANWRKFPAARFFAHYAAGCALIESLYQSIASPLQIYLVGDPLASPWAPAAEVVLEGLPEGDVSGVLSVAARVRAEPGDHFGRFLFLLDGRGVGREPTLRLDTGGLAGGEHTLRCVAYRTGLARSQAFTERSFRVAARR
ncbi:MAG: hypothetical protein FJ225_04025 [Lentisphaerae bacterium]|nr:hypothetical protein [Lentisphaerota bacterium]